MRYFFKYILIYSLRVCLQSVKGYAWNEESPVFRSLRWRGKWGGWCFAGDSRSANDDKVAEGITDAFEHAESGNTERSMNVLVG